MTLEELQAKVRAWDLQHSGDAAAKSKYGIILDQLFYHGSKEWRVFLPAEHPDFNPSYMERLAAWIGNVNSDDDQKLLLEYALLISFFSHDDFAALYRTAMDREISRWVATQVNARLENSRGDSFDELVRREISLHTWFCPITDSMDINEFYKINHLAGVGHRPGFASQQMIAEKQTNPNPQLNDDWLRYMANPSSDPLDPTRRRPPLNRIVLLEDIVGSASQCIDAINWAVRCLGKPVLFVPLILCPNGVDALRAEEKRWNGRLIVRPVIELRRSDLLGPERQGHQGWSITESLEKLAVQYAGRASAYMDTFGYKGTGCSIVTFANTPDNTLPLVHNKPKNGDWAPLFPRIFRD